MFVSMLLSAGMYMAGVILYEYRYFRNTVEGRGQRARGKGQRAEGRTQSRGQRAEGRTQKSRSQKAEAK
jgi:hypothetical protein